MYVKLFFFITVLILIKLQYNVTDIFILKIRDLMDFRSNRHPLAPIRLPYLAATAQSSS
jgi:hypothetical protein